VQCSKMTHAHIAVTDRMLHPVFLLVSSQVMENTSKVVVWNSCFRNKFCKLAFLRAEQAAVIGLVDIYEDVFQAVPDTEFEIARTISIMSKTAFAFHFRQQFMVFVAQQPARICVKQ